MRILLTGASGFIGREVGAALAARSHEVVAAVRKRPRAPAMWARETVIVDMNAATHAADWEPLLAGCDAVINCAGVLQGTRKQSIEAIHAAGPIALFQACERLGVRRIVQISAISAEPAAGTAYASTKLAADDYLRSTPLEWVVLRPSLVVARGAYGGTSLMRALAALPFAIPVPGDGSQSFQPIHVDDLARVVVGAIEADALVRSTVDPVGSEVVTLRALLLDYRRWLGLAPAPVVRIPAALVAMAVRLGDRLGGPLNSTARAQMQFGNTGDSSAFESATGCGARGWRAMLAAHPAHAQDLWHARLYFVRPLLRVTLALLWAGSAVAGFLALGEWGPRLAGATGLGSAAATATLAGACLADLVLAALLVARWRPRALAAVQVLTVLGYTAVATVLWPALWVDPLGSLLKNLPIVAAALALGAIEEER